MSISMSLLWLVAIIAFAVIEALTPSALVSIWFAVGALIALIVSFLTPTVWVQVVVFFVVSIGVLALLRPLTKKYFTPKTSATNADRWVGEVGVVTQRVDNFAATGQVSLKGQVWTARSEDDSVLEDGAHVQVVRIEGVKVIVKVGE